MKLKYYGVGVGLTIAISCITLTFIYLNNIKNKIKNKLEVVATSSEQVYSPNNKQNIDDEKIQPSKKVTIKQD
jgi:predicted small secreted protein